MMDVLHFVFSGFWTFIGCMMLLGLMVRGIVALASIARGKCNHGAGFVCEVCDPLDCYGRL